MTVTTYSNRGSAVSRRALQGVCKVQGNPGMTLATSQVFTPD